MLCFRASRPLLFPSLKSRYFPCICSIPPLWFPKPTWPGHSGHLQGKNGEFCVTVGYVTKTAGILLQSVKAVGC